MNAGECFASFAMTVGRRATNVGVRTVVAEPSIRLVHYASQIAKAGGPRLLQDGANLWADRRPLPHRALDLAATLRAACPRNGPQGTSTRCHRNVLQPVIGNDSVRVGEARSDILRLQARVILKD